MAIREAISEIGGAEAQAKGSESGQRLAWGNWHNGGWGGGWGWGRRWGWGWGGPWGNWPNWHNWNNWHNFWGNY